MQELILHDVWFQQNGAACHTARVTMDLLRGQIGENFISCSWPVSWPSKWGNLAPLDYFLCGYVKAHAYTNKPASTNTSEDNIEAFICKISTEILERVCQNWTTRMDDLKRSRDQHLHEVILKHFIIWTVLSIQIKISWIFPNFLLIFFFFFFLIHFSIALKKSPGIWSFCFVVEKYSNRLYYLSVCLGHTEAMHAICSVTVTLAGSVY